jgi:hypothetical protein
VGVDREPFSSLTRAATPPIADPEPCDPSRLVSPRSWCFLDLKRKAIASSWHDSPGYNAAGMLAAGCCDVGWCTGGWVARQAHVAQLTEETSGRAGSCSSRRTWLVGGCRDGYEDGGVGMPAMESTLGSRDGWESIGFAVESAQQRHGFWCSTSCLFFMRGIPCRARTWSPKRIAPKRRERRKKSKQIWPQRR